MRNQLKTFYSALLIVATLGLTSTVHGIPAFARQTGLDCNSCHAASGFPTLNAFGAAFKAGGYTQANEDDLIGDGAALSIPKTLNMTVVAKAMVANITGGKDNTGKEDKGKSEYVLPDELNLLIGGRIGTIAGFLLEHNLVNGDINGAKIVVAPEIGPVRLGIVAWHSTNGPSYMFETLSTGANSIQRPGEEVKGAAKLVGLSDLTCQGLGLYVWHPMGFVAVSPVFGVDLGGTTYSHPIWSDANDTSAAADNMSWYVRAAATPTIGNINFAVGVQFMTGKHLESSTVGSVTTSASKEFGVFVVDGQLMMDVGIPLSAYVSYGMQQKPSDKLSGVSAYVEASIVPDVFMAGLLFKMTTNDKTHTSDFGVVAKYHIFRNLKAELDFTYGVEDDNGTANDRGQYQITPMIFAAF